MADDMLIDKKIPEGSDDSMDSPEVEAFKPLEDSAVAQKRKGGRKPIYATSEERKQRNRQAQADFRERRTKYIKQLEETIRAHEMNLHNLQTTHQTAADECIVLRYKNSLLQRILIDKGIDVEAELGAKNSSPKLALTDIPRDTPAICPQPRIKPKIELGASPQFPQSHPTPSFQASLQTPKPSNFDQPRVTMPPASDFPAPALGTAGAIGKEPGYIGTKGIPVPAAEHPSPSQRHMGINTLVESTATHLGGNYEQLGKLTRPSYRTSLKERLTDSIRTEQEYETQIDMVDNEDILQSRLGPYPGILYVPQPNIYTSQNQSLDPHSQVQQLDDSFNGHSCITQLLDQFDPILGIDSFSFSAGVQFPTQFPTSTSSMR